MARVMLVDDDPTTVRLLQTLLELDGFEISVAGRGADVLALAEQAKPELFMIDYHLSDVDGVEVIRDLRQNSEFAQTPIVMTSGLDVEDEALEAGASTFLVKPFEPDELPALFNSLISG